MNNTEKQEGDPITLPAVVFIFILTGVLWFGIFFNFLHQKSFQVTWECNGTQFNLEVVAKPINLKCYENTK